MKRKRQPKGSPVCINGHQYTPENTYINPKRPNSRVCRTCVNVGRKDYYKKWWSNNWRKYHFKYRYGITEADYDAMLKSQNGVCAICHRTNNEVVKETGEPRPLHVDHNHTTGKVRGLLCGRCNKSIGQFGESIEIFQRVIEYLKRDAA